MVAGAWDEGRHEEIRLYCADDVTCVRKIWCRIAGEIAPVEIEEEVIQQFVEVVDTQDKPAGGRGKVIPPFLLTGIEGRAA